MKERWKPVVGFEGLYEVSNLGRVRSLGIETTQRHGRRPDVIFTRRSKPRVLRPGVASHGYPTVVLKQKSFCLHELVLTAFVGPRPTAHVCRHLDGNKLHNSLSNLAWGTESQNRLDVKWHRGTGQKLTFNQVFEIRRLLPSTSVIELSRRFKVSRPAIRAIRDGRTYVDL